MYKIMGSKATWLECAANARIMPQLNVIPKKTCGHQVNLFAKGYTITNNKDKKPRITANEL